MSSVHLTMVTTLVILTITTLALASARPPSFADNTVSEDLPVDSPNLLGSGLKPWQLDMLVQRLSEINQQQQGGNGGGGGGGYAWERAIRSPESKRQSRYRQCYFNPISCFRK